MTNFLMWSNILMDMMLSFYPCLRQQKSSQRKERCAHSKMDLSQVKESHLDPATNPELFSRSRPTTSASAGLSRHSAIKGLKLTHLEN